MHYSSQRRADSGLARKDKVAAGENPGLEGAQACRVVPAPPLLGWAFCKCDSCGPQMGTGETPRSFVTPALSDPQKQNYYVTVPRHLHLAKPLSGPFWCTARVRRALSDGIITTSWWRRGFYFPEKRRPLHACMTWGCGLTSPVLP